MSRVRLELHSVFLIAHDLVEDLDLLLALFGVAQRLDLEFVLVLHHLARLLQVLRVPHRHEIISMDHDGHLGRRVVEQARIRTALVESALSQGLGVLHRPVDGCVPRAVHTHLQLAALHLLAVLAVLLRQVDVHGPHRLRIEVGPGDVGIHELQVLVRGKLAQHHPEALARGRRGVQLGVHIRAKLLRHESAAVIRSGLVALIDVYPSHGDGLLPGYRPALVNADLDVHAHLFEILDLFLPRLGHQLGVQRRTCQIVERLHADLGIVLVQVLARVAHVQHHLVHLLDTHEGSRHESQAVQPLLRGDALADGPAERTRVHLAQLHLAARRVRVPVLRLVAVAVAALLIQPLQHLRRVAHDPRLLLRQRFAVLIRDLHAVRAHVADLRVHLELAHQLDDFRHPP